jgi:hypothetical protein
MPTGLCTWPQVRITRCKGQMTNKMTRRNAVPISHYMWPVHGNLLVWRKLGHWRQHKIISWCPIPSSHSRRASSDAISNLLCGYGVGNIGALQVLCTPVVLGINLVSGHRSSSSRFITRLRFKHVETALPVLKRIRKALVVASCEHMFLQGEGFLY